MPELPEVQALADDLGGRLTGRAIDRVSVTFFPALKTFDPPLDALAGRTIAGVTRHGKFLDLATDDGPHLVIHLARAGWIRWRDTAPKPSGRPGSGPIAARLVLDDGSGFDVTEAGTKKSVAISVVADPADVPGIARLGPDPLDPGFTEDAFAAILAEQGRAQIKGVLRSQAVIAGIGNAYSDEILHAARMSPFARADMPREQVHVLYDALQTTLRTALADRAGVPASELKSEKRSNLRVHGRTGEPCPVCGDTIRQVTYADSNFQYCPTCQTGGKPLADRVLSRLLK
ncbi:Fpg/Nei family DNA glycosylase [Pseudolysinimonas sp.]|uniref:Fpg/Nei family DNA glycosylase n=1 Tax=Pseudolysinimonas sp. TaxID=2680009 RepID=UPI003F7E7462